MIVAYALVHKDTEIVLAVSLSKRKIEDMQEGDKGYKIVELFERNQNDDVNPQIVQKE